MVLYSHCFMQKQHINNMSEKIINYTYPCTRNIDLIGFGSFLEKEIGKPRKNLKEFAAEFGKLVSTPGDDISNHLVLVNSGSSANLVAALHAVPSLLQSALMQSWMHRQSACLNYGIQKQRFRSC